LLYIVLKDKHPFCYCTTRNLFNQSITL